MNLLQHSKTKLNRGCTFLLTSVNHIESPFTPSVVDLKQYEADLGVTSSHIRSSSNQPQALTLIIVFLEVKGVPKKVYIRNI